MHMVEQKLSTHFKKPIQLFSGGTASFTVNHIPEASIYPLLTSAFSHPTLSLLSLFLVKPGQTG